MMKILIMLILAMNCWSCSGFPVYDYDPSSVREALSASVAKVNSQSLSPYLFWAFRSSIRRVNVLDDDTLSMDLEFSIRETTCRRDSGQDPSTCDFQRGYFVPTAVCRSTVQVSADQVQDVWAHCGWSSSSESNSSEEMIFGDILGPYKWRNSYQLEDICGINNKITEQMGEEVLSYICTYDADLIPDELRNRQFSESSSEIMRRAFPPGSRRYPDRQYRARIHTGFE